MHNEPQAKVVLVAFGSLVVEYTKYLTWMPLLAPSMNSFFLSHETLLRNGGRRHTDAFKEKLSGI